MTKNRRKWPLLALIFVVAGLALGAWFAHAQGWLDPAYAWVRHWTTGHESADHAPGGMQGMAGMESMAGMPGMEMPPDGTDAEPGVPGYAAVTIEPGLQQRIGVTIGEVIQEPLRMSVQTVGTVQPDETKTARVYLRTEGWVEELFVNFTGQAVQQGDPLLAIYSPEFVTAQEEYLGARRSDASGVLRESGRLMARMALRKLQLLGISNEELQELETTGRSQTHLTLRSPVTGTVLEKNVLQGEYITSERELYEISDLSTVWVQAKIYQYELPHVELGKAATVTIPGLPGERFEGKVVFIQPTVERETRTVQVRIELPNPEGLLKPDMFVEVEIQHPMGEGLLVPAAAVFRTGERDIVFQAESETRFVPVEVEVSPMKFAGERYHVLAGLHEGDRIINSANFLIDSESRLRFGGGGMMPGMPGMEMGDKQDMDHSKMKH